MASLVNSIKNWFRGKQDQVAEKLKDDVRDGKFAIEDSKKQVNNFRTQVASLIASNNDLVKKLADAKENSKKFQKIAKAAAEQGNEADVRSAIEKKKTSDSQVAVFDKEIKNNEAIIARLKKQLAVVDSKIASSEVNFTTLKARKGAANIRKQLSQASLDMGDGPIAALDDLEKAVNQEESEAEAFEELAGDSTSLEDKYSISNSEIDDEVAKLMEKAKAST